MITFLMLPLYTNYISPEGYGYYDLYSAYAILFATFFYMDIFSGIMKFAFESIDKYEKQSVVNSGIALFLISTAVYSLFILWFSSNNKIEYLWFVLLYGVCYGGTNLYGYLARTYEYNVQYAVSGILNAFINVCVNLFLVLVIHMDYLSLYIAYIVAALFQCIFLETKVRLVHNYKWQSVNIKQISRLLKFSLPLAINSTSFWLLSSINKAIITNQLSASQNGYYAIVQKFSNLLITVMSCVAMAWQEVAFQRYSKDDETAAFYSEMAKKYTEVLLICCIGFLPVVFLSFPMLIGQPFWSAKRYIPLNILAVTINILSNFFSSIVNTYKKNFELMLSNVAACFIDYIVIVNLIDYCELESANLALIVAYSAALSIRVIIIKREIKFVFSVKTLLVGVVPCMISFLCFWYGNFCINILLIILILLFVFIKYREEIKTVLKK